MSTVETVSAPHPHPEPHPKPKPSKDKPVDKIGDRLDGLAVKTVCVCGRQQPDPVAEVVAP